MQSKDQSQAGLILLAIIDQLPNSTREMILDCSVNSLYLDYFSAAENLETLIQQHLVHDSQNKKEVELTASGKPVSRLNITADGESVLDALRHTLPKQMADYLLTLSQTKAKEKQLIAHYQMTSEENFIVKLSQTHKAITVISIELNVPTEAIARTICQGWLNNAEVKYKDIFSVLMK